MIKHINFPLSKLSIINVGGVIKEFYEIDNIYDLVRIIKEKSNIFVIGNLTNLVLKDQYESETAIKITAKKIKINDDYIEIESGVLLPYLARFLSSNGIVGFNRMLDIPASLGGAIVNNASSYNQAISDLLIDIKLVDFTGNIVRYTKEQLNFSYRNSLLKINKIGVIFSARFRKILGDKNQIMDELNICHERRTITQPKGIKTLGSTFKNHSSISAWSLIDGCGLRGFVYKNIRISSKHPNFLEIIGKINQKDILELIAVIKDKVYNVYDILLEEEIEIQEG